MTSIMPGSVDSIPLSDLEGITSKNNNSRESKGTSQSSHQSVTCHVTEWSKAVGRSLIACAVAIGQSATEPA